jgi:hypothetical protein
LFHVLMDRTPRRAGKRRLNVMTASAEFFIRDLLSRCQELL